VKSEAGDSTLQASRAPFDAKKNPLGAEFARKYTFYLPLQTVSASQESAPLPPIGDDTAPRPQGYGTGTLSVSTSGVVKWTGTLGDGSPCAQSTLLDAHKHWPLFALLYKTRGYIAGTVIHDPAAAESDLTGEINWVKPPNPVEKYFAGGFKNEAHSLIGVNFTPPGRGQRVLSGYDVAPQNAGPLTLTEGNLDPGGILGTLTVQSNNTTIASSAAEKLKVTLNAKTGAVGGSFVFPLTRKVTPIKGVILQGKIGRGVGFFSGSTVTGTSLATGRFEFLPAAP